MAQAHPEATAPTVGPHVPWTSGVISEVDPTEEDPKQARTMHHAPASWLSCLPLGLQVWWLWVASAAVLGNCIRTSNPKPYT